MGPSPDPATPAHPNRDSEPAISRLNLLLGAAALFVAVVAFAVVTRPVTWLLGYVADDAFYYLQIARHIAMGHGATFDGINPTNGFHPLWMLLLVGCAAITHTSITLLKLSLALSFALHIAGSLALTGFFRRIVGPVPGTYLGIAWMVNPFPLQLCVLGMESSVSILCVALILYWRVRFAGQTSNSDGAPLSHMVVLGVLLAAATYARTDLAIVGVFVLASLAVRSRTTILNAVPGAAKRRIVGLAVAIGVWAFCLVPWAIVSHSITGSLVQDSAQMKSLWTERMLSSATPAMLVRHVAWALVYPWTSRTLRLSSGWSDDDSPAWLVGYVIALALLIVAARKSLLVPIARVYTLWFLGFVLVTGIAFGIAVEFVQLWHSAVAGLLLLSVAGIWLAAAVATVRDERNKRWAWGTVCIIPALLSVGAIFASNPYYPWQRDVYASQPKFEEMVPAGARIGCINAGIPAYFSKRTIVNLDGLVNHGILPYWRSNRMDAYLRDAKIEYVIDDVPSLLKLQLFCARNKLPIKPMANYPMQNVADPGRLMGRVVASP